MKSRRSVHEIEVEASRLNLKQPLARFLIVLFRQFEDELISELSKSGHRSISPADFNVLRHIDPRGISAVRIAQLAGVTKQAIGKQIAKLETDGWITRKDDPIDQRAKIVIFTKKGERLLHDAFSVMQKIENRYARILGGKAELDQVKAVLQSLIQT